ncbi:MAG: ATP-grasp domain-containing protein [Bryobacteraceae bacterium]
MTQTRPVLLFHAVQHISVAVARSLHKRGIEVTLADVSGCARLAASRAISKTLRLPSSLDQPEEFIEALVNLIRSGGYDTLLPCSDPGLAAVSTHYERLRSLLYVGCPPPPIVERVLDKRLTMKIAAACGILTPSTYTPTDVFALRDLRAKLRFPIIAKPLSKVNETIHTFKLRYFANFQDLESAFLHDAQFGTTNLLQEYCVGEGVGIEVLLHKGEPVALFQHRRVRELPPTGGGSVVCVSEAVDPLLRDQAVELLREVGWEGVAMVEFRHDRSTGAAFLMEVNGRYWGSLPLAVHAGVDFPLYEWQLAHGERICVPSSYAAGMRCRWLVGDLRRLYAVLTEPGDDGFPRASKGSEMAAFCMDFFARSCPAMWSWSDPLAAWNEVRSGIGAVSKRVKRALKRPIQRYRYFGLHTTWMLLRLRTLSAMGLSRHRRLSNPDALRSVLFVCEGNIIRSPMAEALLREYLKGRDGQLRVAVWSAGLAPELKVRADERARTVAPEFGVSLDDHRPQGLTREQIERADAIFIMDHFNQARMLVSHPEAASKTFFLGVYSQREHVSGKIEIADPFDGSLDDVRQCYRGLEVCVRQLAVALGVAEEDAADRAAACIGKSMKDRVGAANGG